MANGSSRIVPALLALLVGLAIGWVVHRPARPAAGHHLIAVGPEGNLTEPEARISKPKKHRIHWFSPEGLPLSIAFPESRFPEGAKKQPPFAGMTQQDTDWVVGCTDGRCFSGEINPDLVIPEGKELRYKYDQIVGDKRVDGMIIIEP